MTITPDHLRDLIDTRGDSPAALARRAQVDPANLELYLNGQGQPCPREQQRLALALAVPVADLHDEHDTLAA